MSFATQKLLAKVYVTSDVQYGGRGEVVQLEAIELQEPAKKQVDRKPDAP